MSSRSTTRIFLITLALASLAAAASGQVPPIVFIHEGRGSGTLDGVPFGVGSPAAFTITATGNLADRTNFGGGWEIDHTTALITIDGGGSVQFITPTRTFVNNILGLVGFSRSITREDLFNGPQRPAFESWDMTGSIGPIDGTGTLIQWGLFDVVTSEGVLFFDDSTDLATFTVLSVIFADGFESGDTSAW